MSISTHPPYSCPPNPIGIYRERQKERVREGWWKHLGMTSWCGGIQEHTLLWKHTDGYTINKSPLSPGHENEKHISPRICTWPEYEIAFCGKHVTLMFEKLGNYWRSLTRQMLISIVSCGMKLELNLFTFLFCIQFFPRQNYKTRSSSKTIFFSAQPTGWC